MTPASQCCVLVDPPSFDIADALRTQKHDNRWGQYVQQLLRAGHTKPRGGVDMGDHPPITPCCAMAAHEAGGNSGRVFELIVRHFVATVSPDAVWLSTRVKLIVEPAGEQFVAMAKTLKFPGEPHAILSKLVSVCACIWRWTASSPASQIYY